MYTHKHSDTNMKIIFVNYILTVKLCFWHPGLTFMKQVTARFIVLYFKHTTFFSHRRTS